MTTRFDGMTVDAQVAAVHVKQAGEKWQVHVHSFFPPWAGRPAHRFTFICTYSGLGADVFARNDAAAIRNAGMVEARCQLQPLGGTEGHTIYSADVIRPLTHGCTCDMQPERCAVHADQAEEVAA